ncbi:hypothetical protein LJC10_03025 [Selenomonadales bacterium OttesenSCG-928-I06]|nr:hypothetical protein [Selenomonadales bacterium OttesenSCG-928-I06]
MYKLNETKIFCDIADGFAVLINTDTGIYFGMNQLGTLVFENLIKGISVNTILKEFKQVPEVPSDMDERLNTFIEILLDKELLIPAETNEESFLLDKNLAKAEQFVLDCSEHADAQSLLLADPIHDVQKDVGWTPVLK